MWTRTADDELRAMLLQGGSVSAMVTANNLVPIDVAETGAALGCQQTQSYPRQAGLRGSRNFIGQSAIVA